MTSRAQAAPMDPIDLAELKAQKPTLRGYSHAGAFFVAVGAGSVLVAAAPTPLSTLASTIYVATLCLLFGVSASYHLVWWGPRMREFFARLDHAMIFLFIAGSNTPFSLLALSTSTAKKVLIPLWTAAIVCALLRLSGKQLPRFFQSLSYVALGWFAAWSMPEAFKVIGVTGVALLAFGGVAYTVGAIIFWKKAPNPIPRVFGYHEVFHALTIVAGAAHFVAVARLVLSVQP